MPRPPPAPISAWSPRRGVGSRCDEGSAARGDTDMPENLTRQILKEHLEDGELKPGRPISIRMDQALLQDATGTMALMQFEELGEPRIKLERAVQYIDHNVVQLDFKNPDDHRMLQALARKYGLHLSRPGHGISHYLHMERYGKPGQTM